MASCTHLCVFPLWLWGKYLNPNMMGQGVRTQLGLSYAGDRSQWGNECAIVAHVTHATFSLAKIRECFFSWIIDFQHSAFTYLHLFRFVCRLSYHCTRFCKIN